MEAQENFYPGEDEYLQKDYAENEKHDGDTFDEDAESEDDKESDGSLDTRIGADSDVDDSDAQSAI